MYRSIFVLLTGLCFAALTYAQTRPTPSSLPAEIDTIRIGDSAVLSQVDGEILTKDAQGNLVQVLSGTRLVPGTWLLVRKGASFAVGRTIFQAENHGDRQVVFAAGSPRASGKAQDGRADGQEGQVGRLAPLRIGVGEPCIVRQGSAGQSAGCVGRQP